MTLVAGERVRVTSVTTHWLRSGEKPLTKRDVELSGYVEIQRDEETYRVVWDKLNGVDTVRLNKAMVLEFDPYHSDEDESGGWMLAHFVTASSIIHEGEFPYIPLSYKRGDGNLGAFDIVKEKAVTASMAALDHSQIQRLLQFCRIYGTKM